MDVHNEQLLTMAAEHRMVAACHKDDLRSVVSSFMQSYMKGLFMRELEFSLVQLDKRN